jgi:6-pyruvoyltetrahydropterin/6-carboxytetrahydropterin synthase
MYTVHLAKELFKFSCSHFTILSAEHAERLHGHNYQVRVDITVAKVDSALGFAFDFNSVKPLIRKICESLDERILLPAQSPYLKIKTAGAQVEASFGKKNYSFPADDTLVLPLSNITSEELARYICERLLSEMTALPHWTSVAVQVEETLGQSVTYLKQR